MVRACEVLHTLELEAENPWQPASSSPYSTAWGLLAAVVAGRHFPSDPEVVADAAASYLLVRQGSDGGWGSGRRPLESRVVTPYCLLALVAYHNRRRNLPQAAAREQAIRRARAFVRRQAGWTGWRQMMEGGLAAQLHPVSWLADRLGLHDTLLRRLAPEPLRTVGWSALPSCSDICSRLLDLNTLLPRYASVGTSEMAHDLELRQLANGSFFCPVVDVTAITTIAMSLHRAAEDSQCVARGAAYIASAQNPDGGFPQFFPNELFVANYLGFLISTIARRRGLRIPGWLQDKRAWLLDKQNPDGSWSYSASYPTGDLDDTAWAVMWLVAGFGMEPGSPEISRALSFVARHQAPEGGFPAWPGLTQDIDVTAHAVHALSLDARYRAAVNRGVQFLLSNRGREGRWGATWHTSPVYGTTQVLLCLAAAADAGIAAPGALSEGLQVLVQDQAPDGSWGETGEETALAVHCIACVGDTGPDSRPAQGAMRRGLDYLASWRVGLLAMPPELWVAQFTYTSKLLAGAPVLATTWALGEGERGVTTGA